MTIRPSALLGGILAATIMIAGCGRHDDHGHHHDHDHDHKHDHDHDHAGHDHAGHNGHHHDRATPPGASFKAGKGVVLSEETRTNLGVQVAPVSRRSLPNQIRLTVQLFGERHRHVEADDHTGCDMQGSGFLATNTAMNIKAGQPVQVFKGTNEPIRGVVLATQKAIALGEIEIVVGVSNAIPVLKPGEFVSASIQLSESQPVRAVPASAVLRTAEGTFAYVKNEGAYLRKPVKIGIEAERWVEIIDGLAESDVVVTTPVETLWLVELRATKGGGHSH